MGVERLEAGAANGRAANQKAGDRHADERQSGRSEHRGGHRPCKRGDAETEGRQRQPGRGRRERCVVRVPGDELARPVGRCRRAGGRGRQGLTASLSAVKRASPIPETSRSSSIDSNPPF